MAAVPQQCLQSEIFFKRFFWQWENGGKYRSGWVRPLDWFDVIHNWFRNSALVCECVTSCLCLDLHHIVCLVRVYTVGKWPHTAFFTALNSSWWHSHSIPATLCSHLSTYTSYTCHKVLFHLVCSLMYEDYVDHMNCIRAGSIILFMVRGIYYRVRCRKLKNLIVPDGQ